MSELNTILRYSTRTLILNCGEREEIPKKFINYISEFDDQTRYPLISWTAGRLSHSSKYGACMVVPPFVEDYILRKHFPNHKIVDCNDEFTSWRHSNINIKKEFVLRDDRQRGAADFLLAKKKWQGTANARVKAINLDTGDGKTFLSIFVACERQSVPLILVHQKSFIKQWTAKILEYTDIKEDEIFVISGKDSIGKTIKEHDKIKIIIGIHRTFFQVLEKPKGRVIIADFVSKCGIGQTFIDEAHLEMKAIFHFLATTNIQYTTFLSATFKKRNKSAKRVMDLIIPEQLTYGKAHHVRDKFHKLRFILINSKPSTEWLKEMSKTRGISSAVYGNYINEESFDRVTAVIRKILNMVYSTGKKPQIAFLAPRCSTIVQLVEWLREEYPNSTVGDYSTNIKNENKREESLLCDIIVSTVSSFSAGKDTDVEYLINLVPMAAEGTTFPQAVGRLRGGNGKQSIFYDIIDCGFKRAYPQFKERERFALKELSTDIKIVDYRKNA
jgi:hypothetical protein